MTDAPSAGESSVTGPGEPATVPCNPSSPFGTPTLVPGLESAATEGGPPHDPRRADRLFLEQPRRRPLENVNVAGLQYDPVVTGDALTLAFGSDRAGADGTFDLFLASRAAASDAFAEVAPIAGLDTASNDQQPFLLPDGSAIYFSSDRAGDSDLYRAIIAPGGRFMPPAPLTELNTPSVNDEHPAVSPDELTIVFSSRRNGGVGNVDVWMAHRARASDPFGAPVDLTVVNSADKDIPDWISPDGCRLYLHSDRGGSPHEYVGQRAP